MLMPSPATIPTHYLGRNVALLTKHGKEQVITPVLESAIGCRVHLVGGFDTDQLGTFTRDIPRRDTQLETARKKARIGMELSGALLGIASEGSFGPDPMIGIIPWDTEILIFIDDESGIEILGTAQGSASHTYLLTDNWDSVRDFAGQVNFPAHQLVVRPEDKNDPRLIKGIDSWPELEKSFNWAQAQAANRQVFLENDLRAHANPTRMAMIRRAAEDLAAKLQSFCPACGLPGFWIVERISGLLCRDCGEPTNEIKAEVYGCVGCRYRFTRESAETKYADPGRCPSCNP
jgi:hypothetical protein